MDGARGDRSAPRSDAELVDRLKKGDEKAFEELYDRYFKRIYAFVDRRLNIRADVEETTQEVFVNVFSSIDGYRGEAPFPAWIFGITRRVIAARFKRKRHATVPLADEEADQLAPMLSGLANMSLEASPLENYEHQERLGRMTDALENRLTEEQRTLFRLHHLEERSIADIARALDKSTDAIKSNLYRTRKLLLAR